MNSVRLSAAVAVFSLMTGAWIVAQTPSPQTPSATKPATPRAGQPPSTPRKPAGTAPATAKPQTPPAPGTPASRQVTATLPAGSPLVTMETSRGTIVFGLFAKDAPKSVEHITKLIKRNFYNGQRIHRKVPGQLVQFGDPQTRDMTLRDWWGRGLQSGSGAPIGVGEIVPAHRFLRGMVGLAHAGDAAGADSQMFITLRPMPQWNGKYAAIGQVTSGMEIADTLVVEDAIKKVTIAPGK